LQKQIRYNKATFNNSANDSIEMFENSMYVCMYSLYQAESPYEQK